MNEDLETIKDTSFAKAQLKRIRVSANVKTIKCEMFRYCQSLQWISFTAGNRLKEVEQYAFQDLGIVRFSTPLSLRILGDYAFQNCRNLRVVQLNEGLERIGVGCFSYTRIEELYVPASVKTIGTEAFKYCKNLSAIRFAPDSRLNTVESWAFYNSGLETFIAPASLRKLGEKTFFECPRLRTVELNEGLEVIDECCFTNSGVEVLRLPHTVRDLAFSAFHGSKALRTLELPDRLKPFRDAGAFNAKVKKFVVPCSVKEMPGLAFCGFEQLRKVGFEKGSRLELVGENALSRSCLESFAAPPSLREIRPGAF